jgi:hypothetical protein
MMLGRPLEWVLRRLVVRDQADAQTRGLAGAIDQTQVVLEARCYARREFLAGFAVSKTRW